MKIAATQRVAESAAALPRGYLVLAAVLGLGLISLFNRPRDRVRQRRAFPMFGFGKQDQETGPRVSLKLCSQRFNGKYAHVGLFDCRVRQVWVCRPLAGQAIRTSHARLITGAQNAVSTAWKDRFLCYWFYTPRSGEGYIHGYPIDWDEAHLLVRIDPNWDYDRQRIVPAEMEDQVNDNLERQFRHGERVLEFYRSCKLKYPFSLHFVGARATESQFYVRRIEAQGGNAER